MQSLITPAMTAAKYGPDSREDLLSAPFQQRFAKPWTRLTFTSLRKRQLPQSVDSLISEIFEAIVSPERGYISSPFLEIFPGKSKCACPLNDGDAVGPRGERGLK